VSFRPGNLTQGELVTLVTWLMNRLPSEDRGELMAQYPVLYLRLHPGTGKAVLEQVTRTLAVLEPGISLDRLDDLVDGAS